MESLDGRTIFSIRLVTAKYKQAGLYDYVIKKYPNLGEDIGKLIDFNIGKRNT